MNATSGQTSPVYKRLPPPEKSDLIILRFLVLGGVISLVQFTGWYVNPGHVGHTVLYGLLSVSLGYKMLHLLYEWYYITSMRAPSGEEAAGSWKVDMLTTFVPGEPLDMVEHTLRAMVAVRYPHTTYLCDEGDDPRLRALCAELGVVHVYRGPDKRGAKAGNINHALREVAAGDICVILDPDHAPVPEFLDRVLPHFDDPGVGYVQCIQAYGNTHESFVARGAAEQTFLFYGPMMMGMHRHGTVQAIGANCTFRRAALDSIGGHAEGLCEDMHTSMRLHAKGWRSVYVPERLSLGRAPSTLAAYYRQQLKWSRGSFELLFRVFPRLFFSFSWRQRLHYFLTPLYFLYGLVGLIDLGVPVVSLLSCHVPLFIDFGDFVLRVLPVLISTIVIRHFVQRYVPDRRETGFYVTGGILRVSTWWVYLVGFAYACVGIRVPYVPTPKEGRVENEWKVCLPNVFVIGLSLYAILYGISLDRTPFTWLMAGFAGLNGGLLGLVIVAAQRRALRALVGEQWIRSKQWWDHLRWHHIYPLIRNEVFAVLFIIVVLGVCSFNFFGMSAATTLAGLEPSHRKHLGWSLLPPVQPAEADGGPERRLAAFSVQGPAGALLESCSRILSYCERKSLLPFIHWELADAEGEAAVDSLVDVFRSFQQPVILCAGWENGADTIGRRRQELVGQFRRGGAGNVAWAWLYGGDRRAYPGREDVDVVVLPVSKWGSPRLVGQLLRDSLSHPVLLLTDTAASPLRRREVTGRLAEAGIQLLGWSFAPVPYARSPAAADPPVRRGPESSSGRWAAGDTPPLRSDTTRGLHRDAQTGEYRWLLDGRPFYVKGIAYNPEHNWRDDRWPLTRRQLRIDFARITAMGANTISRNGPGVYDDNILAIAAETDLKVLYGFWCDPSIDYLRDSARVAALKEEVRTVVKKYRDRPALLAWVVGNGAWSELANYYHPPYLSAVRLAFAGVVDEIARDIKALDPARPVMTALDGSRELAGALENVGRLTPAIDIVAISAFRDEQFAELHRALAAWMPARPYLISEFGVKQNAATRRELNHQNRYLEPSCFEKARLYARLWSGHIEPNRGRNLGGVAYCWRDRMEGTATLSGLVDYQGRLKPAYFALKEVWTGVPQTFPLADVWLRPETVYAHGEDMLVYRAMSSNNVDPSLSYEWYVRREEFLELVRGVNVNYQKLGWWGFKLVSKYYEHVDRGIFPEVMGTEIRCFRKLADAPRRMYLHISDRNGHVVTASYPIYVD